MARYSRYDSQRDQGPGGNGRHGRTGDSNYENDRGYRNQDAYARPPLAPRRGTDRNSRLDDSNLIPTVESSRRNQWTGPNYAAPMARTRTGTGHQFDDGSRAQHASTNYAGTGNGTGCSLNSRMQPPPGRDDGRRRRRDTLPANRRVSYTRPNQSPYRPTSGANATPIGRPMAHPVPRLTPEQRRKAELERRRETKDWRIGDIVNIDVIKASFEVTPSTTTDPQTGDVVYKEKCQHFVPSLGQVIYCEARHGVIIAIHYGDSKLVATVLPIFSYGNDGVKNKSLLFAVQHLTIMNRSEEAEIHATTQGKLDAGHIQDESQGRANPLVPATHTLFVDALDDFFPGRLNSLVAISKSVNVFLDERVRGPWSALEESSRDTLRKVWQMYNTMASLDRQDLRNFDYGEFPWFYPMVPYRPNPTAQPVQNHPAVPQPAVTQPGQPQQLPTPPTSYPSSQIPSSNVSNGSVNNTGTNPLKRKNAPAAELTSPQEQQQRVTHLQLQREKLVKEMESNRRDLTAVEDQLNAFGSESQPPAIAPSGTNQAPTTPVMRTPDNGPHGAMAPKRRKLSRWD